MESQVLWECTQRLLGCLSVRKIMVCTGEDISYICFPVGKEHCMRVKKSITKNSQRKVLNRGENLDHTIYTYKGLIENARCKKVILSEKVHKKIVAETYSYGQDETGGILIGYIYQGNWFVIDMIDAGPKEDTTHTRSFFVYDEEYVNHQLKKQSMIYKFSPSFLGFFHRHPGNLDTFSLPDEKTMKTHCEMNQNGILSMLVNLDPKLRMTFYYVGQDDALYNVKYEISDEKIPKEFLALASYEELAERYHARNLIKFPDEPYAKADKNYLPVADIKKSKSDINHELTKTVLDKEPEQSFSGMLLNKYMDRISKMDSNRYVDEEKVLIPEGILIDKEYEGPLFGFVAETGIYTVIDMAEHSQIPGVSIIGYKANSIEYVHVKIENAEKNLVFIKNGQVRLYDTNIKKLRKIKAEEFSFVQDLTSRNSGLLENKWMKDSTAIISGCGSVGSLVATQLARSGVGNIVLIDSDCLEIHNICRHQLNLSDIGRKKVDAMAEKLKLINPNINVRVFARKFQDVPISSYTDMIIDKDKTIFIGTCDNRVGNAHVCNVADELGVAFAALGFMPRAWGCESFTMLPGELTYETVFEKQIREAIVSERGNHHYLDQEDIGKVTFVPGLDVDLEFGTSFFSKILLDMINRTNENYKTRVFDTLTQYTLLTGTYDIPDVFFKKVLEPFVPMSVEFDERMYDLKKSS